MKQGYEVAVSFILELSEDESRMLDEILREWRDAMSENQTDAQTLKRQLVGRIINYREQTLAIVKKGL